MNPVANFHLISSLSRIDVQNIDKDTLVLFDIDETLLIDKRNKRPDLNQACLQGK